MTLPEDTAATGPAPTHDERHHYSLSLSRLESLLESAQLLHSSLELDDLLRHLLRTVMGRLAAGRALVAVEGDGVMRMRFVRGAPKLKAGAVFDPEAARACGLDMFYTIGDAARPVGLLAVSSPPGGIIEPAEEASLHALLGIAAGGISNARAHAETRRVNQSLDQKVQELRALLDLVRGLAATLEPEAVASLLTLTIAGRWAVRRYALVARKAEHPPVIRAKGMALADIFTHSESLLSLPEAARADELPEGELKKLLADQQVAIVFPLRAGEDIEGLIALGARSGKLAYTDADLEFGAGLVAQAAVAFENSWYVRETVEREKLQQELELAASIQAKLFPDHLPQLDGYDIAAHTRPARQCGGDYYDALPVTAPETATTAGADAAATNSSVTNGATARSAHLFCVADVSGKGLPASLLMSTMQATLRALLGRTASLSELAARANNLLHATTPGNKYVTAILAEFEPQTGCVTYVNAGHNGGVLLRGDGSHEWLKPTGTPIGLFPGFSYDEEITRLAPGDLLALFSDGVPEAQNVAAEEFGEDRLIAYLCAARGETAAQIVADAFKVVDEFAGAAPQFDDITFLVIKCSAADRERL